MPEFTREIKQAQQQADIQPQMRAPTQSLGGDLANLATTGVELYQKIKGQEKLATFTAQQKQFEQRVAGGAEGLLSLRQTLRDQKVPPSVLRQREEQYLRGFAEDSGTRLAIKEYTNKVSGTNQASIAEKLHTEEDERVAARKSLEGTAVELAGFFTTTIDLSKDSNALRQDVLQAQALKARHEYNKSQAALKSTALGNIGKERDLNSEAFLMDYNLLNATAFSQGANKMIEDVDFSDMNQVGDLIRGAQDAKKTILQNARQQASASGIIISDAELKEGLSTTLALYDGVTDFLKRKDIKEMSDNQISVAVNEFTQGLINSNDPDKVALSQYLLLSKAGLKLAGPQEAIVKLHMDALSQGLSGRELPKDEQDESNGFITSIWQNITQGMPDESKVRYTTTILEDLQGGSRRRGRLIANGGLTAYVKGIAKGNPDYVIDESRKGEVLEGLLETSEMFLRSAIPRMLSRDQLINISSTGTGLKQRKGPAIDVKTGENAFDALGDDLKIKIKGGDNKYLGKEARQYNEWVDNVFTAMDKLGASQEEVEEFKYRIKRTFNIASVNE
jgi:hypothetical protein